MLDLVDNDATVRWEQTQLLVRRRIFKRSINRRSRINGPQGSCLTLFTTAMQYNFEIFLWRLYQYRLRVSTGENPNWYWRLTLDLLQIAVIRWLLL
jgi:hypothetical protein